MGDPIISPWLIYLLGVVGAVKFWLGFALAVVGIIGAVCIIAMGACKGEEWDEGFRVCKGVVRRCFIPFVIVVASYTLTPSRETIIGMIVANEVTGERLVQAGEVAGDVREAVKADILDIIKAVSEEEGEE